MRSRPVSGIRYPGQMVTIRRRGFAAVWMVALLVIGLWGASPASAGSGAEISDRAQAVVSVVAGPMARTDVVLPRVDVRSVVSGKLAHDQPAVAAAFLALMLPALLAWRRVADPHGRTARRVAVRGARGPPTRLATP